MTKKPLKDKKVISEKEELQKQIEFTLENGIDLNNNILILDETIDEGTFRCLDTALTFMEKSSRKAITIKINSGGGDTYEAMAIVDRIKASPRIIRTEAYGQVMSAAVLIFAAGTTRLTGANTRFMYHGWSYSTDSDHERTKDFVTEVEIEMQAVNSYLETQTGTDHLIWASMTKYTDRYFNAQKAIELGLAHELK